MSINALEVALRYAPTLADDIRDWRSAGDSIDTVTARLREETKLAIGRESVRAYLKKTEAPALREGTAP